MSGGALDGLLVIAVEQAVAAPLCTARLRDAGARVIKVERPGGDFARGYDSVAGGDSSYFAWTNHGKESIVLDLKQADDKAVLERLVACADVFVQNLAPGALARLGFGVETLRARHPSIVTCSISGYGESAAVRGLKAYDLLVQAESGLVSISGGPGEPGRIGISLCDIGAGVTAHAGILEALIRRGRSGEGGHVDISLFDVAAEWSSVPFAHARYGAGAPTRVGLKHPSIAPYGGFTDADGAITLISIQNEREYRRLCLEVLCAAELADDERYVSNELRVANRDGLDASIAAVVARLSTEEFRARLVAADMAFGALNDIDDLLVHAALRERDLMSSGEIALRLPAHPCREGPGEGAERAGARAPRLDEHGVSIRQEFSA